MSRVAILTPDPADTHNAGLWPKVLARLQRALDGVGIASTPTPWTAHVDDASALRDYARVLPLLAWGYHHDHERWSQACATWQREGIALANPARVLDWNSDKWYLSELAAAGVAVPYTRWTRRLSQAELEFVFDQTGADELIVKPAVSGGAWKTRRVRRGDVVEEAAGTSMLIQPYLSTIESEGETSLLYFGGKLSHAVNKRPVDGEFRVQEEFGGRADTSDPGAGLVVQAAGALAAAPGRTAYARVDGIDRDGVFVLMELELIEPVLYLARHPDAPARLAAAILAG
jgi:hypothetical protein